MCCPDITQTWTVHRASKYLPLWWSCLMLWKNSFHCEVLSLMLLILGNLEVQKQKHLFSFYVFSVPSTVGDPYQKLGGLFYLFPTQKVLKCKLQQKRWRYIHVSWWKKPTKQTVWPCRDFDQFYVNVSSPPHTHQTFLIYIYVAYCLVADRLVYV